MKLLPVIISNSFAPFQLFVLDGALSVYLPVVASIFLLTRANRAGNQKQKENLFHIGGFKPLNYTIKCQFT